MGETAFGTGVEMKKKRSLKALKRDLDERFSVWVRQGKGLLVDYNECVTCGVEKDWRDLHAGHFIPRQYTATRYDPRNVWPQCPRCNTFRHGALTEYTLFMIKTYGQSVVDELLQAKHKTVKMTRSDYEELLAKYS